jgi:UDP-N-acetylglucosamine:LPS N-acetylglucosamine transferase
MTLGFRHSIHGVGGIIVVIVVRNSCLIGLAIPVNMHMEGIVTGTVQLFEHRLCKMGMICLLYARDMAMLWIRCKDI